MTDHERIVNDVLATSMPIKVAAKWEDLSYEAQREYLRKHKGSKKHMTVKPGQKGKPLSELKERPITDLKGQLINPGDTIIDYQSNTEWPVIAVGQYKDFKKQDKKRKTEEIKPLIKDTDPVVLVSGVGSDKTGTAIFSTDEIEVKKS